MVERLFTDAVVEAIEDDQEAENFITSYQAIQNEAPRNWIVYLAKARTNPTVSRSLAEPDIQTVSQLINRESWYFRGRSRRRAERCGQRQHHQTQGH